MKTKKLLLGIICCLSILQFSSCQKEPTATGDSPVDSTTVPKNDSTLLKLFVKLDTLHAAGQDTLYKMEFAYDNLKRLVSYDYSEYDSATGILEYDIFHFKIQYNGIDTLPNKIIFQQYTDPEFHNIITSYENGRLVYHSYSYTGNSGDTVIKKTFYNNGSDIEVTYHQAGTYPNDTVYHTEIIDNGNVTNDVRTYSYDGSYKHLQGTHTYMNSFDGHTNPFKRISFIFQFFDGTYIPYGPYAPQEDGRFTYIMAKSNNNILESKFNRHVYTFNYDNYYAKSYTYNKRGLPVSASYTTQLTQQNQFYAGKELYYYTK